MDIPRFDSHLLKAAKLPHRPAVIRELPASRHATVDREEIANRKVRGSTHGGKCFMTF
jgi:hypothetical protein